jgi:hypothetical protein
VKQLRKRAKEKAVDARRRKGVYQSMMKDQPGISQALKNKMQRLLGLGKEGEDEEETRRRSRKAKVKELKAKAKKLQELMAKRRARREEERARAAHLRRFLPTQVEVVVCVRDDLVC